MNAVQALEPHRPAGLSVPDLPDDVDALRAALAYAAAGWYVGPVARGTKHPGSALGKDWHTLTSRDADVIVSWFAGTDHGVFLHCGRSGALVLDVDKPEALPEWLRRVLEDSGAPAQTTDPGHPGRAHYVFAMPEGRRLGNGVGRLGNGWGEVRGGNGVIVVAPSVHARAEQGARYEWASSGEVPALPEQVAARLDDTLEACDAATDPQVERFLAEHTPAAYDPEPVDWRARHAVDEVGDGASRHETYLGVLVGALADARAGLTSARYALDTLEPPFLAAVTAAGPGQTRTPEQARDEWAGMVGWAVGQAQAADPDTVADTSFAHRTGLAGLIPPERWRQARLEFESAPPSLQADLAARDDVDLEAVRARYPRTDLAGLLRGGPPAREWVVHGLVAAHTSTSLVAPSGVGKSLFLLGLVLDLVRGRPSFAGLTIPRRRRVLVVDLENTETDLHERLTSFGITAEDDLHDLVHLDLPPLPPLDTERGRLEFAAVLDAYRITPDDVVVIDSLQRATAGDEDRADTMRAFYRHTGVEMKRRGVTVLRADNSGKDPDRGARGSSGKRDDVDVEYLLTRHPDSGRYVLKVGKARLLGVEHRTFTRDEGDDGVLRFRMYRTDHEEAVAHCRDLLDAARVPLEAGEGTAHDALRRYAAEHEVNAPARRVVREAVKARKAGGPVMP